MNFTPRYSDTGILAMIIIASNAAANDPGRVSIIKQYLTRLRLQNTRGLNSLRIHIASSELAPGALFYPVLQMARSAGIEIVADSLNAAFYDRPYPEFRDYVGALAQEQITVFCVDDCQRFPDTDLLKMAKVVTANGGQLILSTGAKKENAERIRKTAALTHSHFELQAYRQSESTNWPAIWIDLLAPGCWAFEMHKDKSDQTTTAADVSAMWTAALKLSILPKWLSLYGQDSKTNLLDAKFNNHWTNFYVGLDKWWSKQSL